MSLLDRFRKPEKRATIENPTVPISSDAFMSFFGVSTANLPAVNVDAALGVPAFGAAVNFLASSLANLPLHAYRSQDSNAERVGGSLQRILNEAPNDEWSSYAARKYFWTQVFTGGRGLFWIERTGSTLSALWPLDPGKTTVQMQAGRRVYRHGGQTYKASEIIDVPFLLKRDQVSAWSPVVIGAKAIQLSIAMGDYAAGFFAGGGVPPLALAGPLPAGPEALKRAQVDIKRAVDAAKATGDPVFPIPAGYELKPVGFDPAKGQMTEARRFQVEEIARIFNLPPVFLQDLTHGTFSNTEQQDLHLTKHLVAQWAKAFEDELNLKLFGAANNRRYVEHSLDGLMRGDFKTRMEALSQGVQNALLTPNEGRALENRGAQPGGDLLYIQGATVPLGSQPAPGDQPAADGGQNVA